MRKCLCTGAEMFECHELCAYAGHVGGICEECEQDKAEEKLDPWEALEEGYDIEWDG